VRTYNLCFLGFGNVGRALLRLFIVKNAELRDQYNIEWRLTGVATRRMGWLSSAEGIDAEALLASQLDTGSLQRSDHVREWLEAAQPDAVLETTSLNVETGQPAIDNLRASLGAGAHAITANKGAVVYGYDELQDLARQNDRRFLFEATVMDSAPVFSLFREALPVIKIRGFSAVFNSTTSVILEAMEEGRSFAEGVAVAQELGIAETDPSHDVDGWDATVKVCALARVLLRVPLKPGDVRREGIRDLDQKLLRAARGEGRPFKLLARASVTADGQLTASVRPEQIGPKDPLSGVRGTSLAVHFELDMMPGLTIISHRPNLQSTAYGLLADFVNAVGPEYKI